MRSNLVRDCQKIQLTSVITSILINEDNEKSFIVEHNNN
jgi:hypothetical protein